MTNYIRLDHVRLLSVQWALNFKVLSSYLYSQNGAGIYKAVQVVTKNKRYIHCSLSTNKHDGAKSTFVILSVQVWLQCHSQ